MRIKLELDTSNSAFFEGGGAGVEVARILRGLADQLEDWPGVNTFTLGLRDVNGNKVGTAEAVR